MYKLELTRSAEKQLEKIYRADRNLYVRFLESFEEIRQNPESGKFLKHQLKGIQSYRVGSYRILYCVRRKQLIIVVIDLGHRKDIYQ